MKWEKYSIERLDEPEGTITHKLVYESMTKNNNSGGFGYGIRFRGTYKECLEKKKEIENEISNANSTSFMASRKTQNNK